MIQQTVLAKRRIIAALLILFVFVIGGRTNLLTAVAATKQEPAVAVEDYPPYRGAEPDYLKVKDTPLGPLWRANEDKLVELKHENTDPAQLKKAIARYRSTPRPDAEAHFVRDAVHQALGRNPADYETFRIALNLAIYGMLDDSELAKLATGFLDSTKPETIDSQYELAVHSALLYLSLSPSGVQALAKATDLIFWKKQRFSGDGYSPQSIALRLASMALFYLVENGDIDTASRALSDRASAWARQQQFTTEPQDELWLKRYRSIIAMGQENLQNRKSGKLTTWRFDGEGHHSEE
ncbi:MAG: hypothetical protein HZB26_10455 [Candidatus Hydrogenedentes bacterium]|nr:hypothetical protein [Candidatus Hydrogenedentota bacterium]